MEHPMQQHLFSLCSRPYTASLVWVCLACGQLAPYQTVSYDSLDNTGGFGGHLQSSSSADHAYSSSPPKKTQHLHGHPQYGTSEHTCHGSHEPHSSPPSGGVAASAAIAVAALPSAPVTSTPLRQGQSHSCVNDASDSYLSQAASFSHRKCGQPQYPLSVAHCIAGADMEHRVHLDSAGSTRERRQRRGGALVFAEASNLHASGETFGTDKTAVNEGIPLSRRRRASTVVSAPVTPQFSPSLESTGNRSNALAPSPCTPSAAAIPQLSSASHSLWRHADVDGIQSPLGTGTRSVQEEEDAMHSLSVLLMEEHLIGTREMRFCGCCGEVRCAEIRKATELLPSSLLARAADDISYGDEEGDDLRAAQSALEPQHEEWSAPLTPVCGNDPELLEALLSNCETSERTATAPLDISASAAKSGFQPSKTAQWRSPQPGLRQPAQSQPSVQAKTREEMPAVHHVAFSLTRLLSKVKSMAVAAVQNFHPLSPALPKAYLRSRGRDGKDETAVGNHRNAGLGSDLAQLLTSSISRPTPQSQEGYHPRYPQYDPSEGVEMRGGHWTTASVSTETSRATPSMSVSAEHTPLCLASPLSLAGGGPAEDLNSPSLDSSGQPSWAFTAPDEEEAYTAEEGDEDLIIQHLLGNAPSDEDAGRGGGEDAYMRARRCDEGSTSTSAAAVVTAAAEATGSMRAWKEKWNSISVAEALWRLVLPSFSTPFLTMVSMPATASADRALSLGSKRPIGCLMDWIAFSPPREAAESTASSAVTVGARPYRGFRGDVEEAIRQLNAAQLEVAKLRLQQVLTAVNAEQARREGQSKDLSSAPVPPPTQKRMAGLQSENISVNSTRLPESSTSDRDICAFCLRRAIPSASDPHAPLFPFFSLVDCRHYACQPCALVHCDNAGRRIRCPKCHCVSRLAQSGRRRTRSAAAATDADADRVSIDDGVSSTRSRRTGTSPTPHRSALKGKSGTSKRRANSVQFPANPTTSVVSGESASGAASVPAEDDSAGEAHRQHRASSPLTQDAVDALPLDPLEVQRRRSREQQLLQLRAAEATAKAQKTVSLYAITAAPPPSSTSAGSGTFASEGIKKAKGRSRSQPAPKLPNTILEPKQEYPLPPPLELHTVDEAETDSLSVPGDNRRDAEPAPPIAVASASAAAAVEEDAEAEKSAAPLVSVSRLLITPPQTEDEVQTTATLPPPAGQAQVHAPPQQLLDDCESTETEERGIVREAEAHERAALKQRMEEEDTAIRVRRGLVLEFESTPTPVQQPQSIPHHQHSHHNNAGTLSLGDLSDQVSATSDDELSQRVSAHKSVASSTSTSRLRQHISPSGSSELPTQLFEKTASDLDAKVTKDGHVTAAGTRGGAILGVVKSIAKSRLVDDTLSPMTTARQGHVSADDKREDYGEPVATEVPSRSEDAKKLSAAREEEAEAQAAAIRTAEEARSIAEGQERAQRRQLQRDAAEEAAELKQKQLRREEKAVLQRQLHEERALFARQSLQDRECLAREALEQAEEAVRGHYECSADEWLNAALPHELEAQRRARAAAEHRCQQEQQQAQLAVLEGLQRDKVKEMEADSWSWLLSGARVDRVVAATEEGDRVQREYEELRFERLQLQLREDTAELVREEDHSRASFIEYEAATRSLLQSHYAVQRRALAEDEERQEAELFEKVSARREAAFRQRYQWELDELDVDEVSGRAILREVEREERRTANLVFLQRLASIRRKELLSQHTTPADAATGGKEADMSSVLSDAPTVKAAQVRGRAQMRQSSSVTPLTLGEDEVGGDGGLHVSGVATPPQLRTPLIAAKQLSELRAREAAYAAELQAALERLQEAERRVAEEATIRVQAEQDRQAVRVESERLLREAEQRAEQRIREARDAAEQLLQTQLADLRDEAARRAEHAAVMQALAEEEQRAVLETKLQAAQRQLDEAQHRAQEEVRRAREDAAERAAVDAARAAREAQRREEEWQERCRAENLLRLAEKESEKEEAIRRLAEIEARAAEAVRLAREEAARATAEAQERLADMERRQQAREAEVQLAAQRVRSARDSLREFDSRSQSSGHTTPSGAEHRGQKPSRSSLRHEAPRPLAASSSHASQASAPTPFQTPPLVPPSSHTPSVTQPRLSAQSSTPCAVAGAPEAVAAASTLMCNATPPRVILSSRHTPLSSTIAQGPERGGARVPSSSASAAGAASLVAMDPADIVRAAIRSAVQEIVEAQRRKQTLQDRAEQHVELSERRYHRHQGDRVRAARDVSVIESSYALSEVEESEERHRRRQPCTSQARQRPSVHGHEHNGRTASSGISDGCLYLTRSSRGGYAQEVSNSPWTRSSLSPTSRLSPRRAPMPTASSAAAAAVPGSVSSNTLLSTSSVYFDSIYRPSSAAVGAVHQFHGRYGCSYPAAQQPQKQQPQISFGSYSAASRALFAPRVMHEVRDPWTSEDGEYGYAQSMPVAVEAHAYPRAASRQEQRYVTGAAQPTSQQQQQQPPRPVSVTAALPSAAHAYNDPEPHPPAPAAMDYSPPARRSTTRTAAEVGPQQQGRRAGAGTNVGSGGSVGALPEPSRMCPRCYSTETTSPCWRCGEMICRRCGLPPGSARQLCCTAHHRAQLREFARRKAYESGHPTTSTTAATGKAPSPPPLPQEQHQQHRLRGEQQVQTSFASSADSARIFDTANLADAPAARFDAGTSPLASLSPPCMIPPSAYRAPQQQQQRQPYPQPNYPSVYPAFTMAGPATSLQQPMYSSAYQSVAVAYPYAHSHPPPPQQQQQSLPLQLPFHADSERSHMMPSSLDPSAPPFSHSQPPAPSGYSVRAATAALGSAATGAGFAPGTTVSEAQQSEESATVGPRAWTTTPGLPPSASQSAAVSAAVMPHAPPAGLTQSTPPSSAPPASHQEASEVSTSRDTQGDAIVASTVPATAAVDGTPAAQVRRQPSPPTRIDDSRTNANARLPAATGDRTPPNAILVAAIAGSAAASASLPGRLLETQGGATAPVDAVSTQDGGVDGAAEDHGDGTAGATTAAVLEEPKTERKRTFPAFFVSLCDGEGAAEPRRPKPPTPRNFVPSQLIPPTLARAPPSGKQCRRSSPSGMRFILQGCIGGQAGHRQHPRRKLSPLQAHEMNCPHPGRKSVSPSRGLSAQRRQRHTYPSPYERAPNQTGARDVPRKTPAYPPSQRLHAHAGGTATSMTKSIKSYIKSLSPAIVMDASGTPIVYEDVRKVQLDSCCQPQQQRRTQEWTPTTAPAFHDIYLRTAGIRGGVTESAHDLPASPRKHSKLEGYYVDAPSQPHESSPQLQQQHQCSSRNESYYPRFTSSGATSETMSQPPQQQHPHRYAPSEPHMPAYITYTAPISDRRVPTLAELERRLQQLRLEDEHEAAEYHRRQAQYSHRQQRQQQIYTLLHPTGAVAVGGNTRSFVAPSSYAAGEIAQQQQRRHNSATGRHRQQRTVSPPWRTDLNSSPVRPRWDISQPRLPTYRPAPATTAGG